MKKLLIALTKAEFYQFFEEEDYSSQEEKFSIAYQKLAIKLQVKITKNEVPVLIWQSEIGLPLCVPVVEGKIVFATPYVYDAGENWMTIPTRDRFPEGTEKCAIIQKEINEIKDLYGRLW